MDAKDLLRLAAQLEENGDIQLEGWVGLCCI